MSMPRARPPTEARAMALAATGETGTLGSWAALLISISAGMVVTRVASENKDSNLGKDVAGQIPIAQWFEAPRQIGFGGMGHESRPVEGRGHSTLPSAKDSYRYSPLPVFCE